MQLAGSGACCYSFCMAVHLPIRDVPDEQPTVDEWLDGLSRLTPVSLSAPAAEAVHEARESEEAPLVDALGRS